MPFTLLLPIIVLECILIVISLYDLVRRDTADVVFKKKWIWALLVLFIQPIGPIVYLTTGRKN